MANKSQTLALTNVGFAFDHPEAVAWGPDGRAYAGGEAGQLYRFGLDGKVIEEVARVQGGFLLGSPMTQTPIPTLATTARPVSTASRPRAR